jgi:hypothetical protein
MARLRIIGAPLLVLLLACGLSACTSSPNGAASASEEAGGGAAQEEAQEADAPQLEVDLPELDGAQLLEGFTASYASYSGQLSSIALDISAERREASLTIKTALAGIEEAQGLGEAVALFLSEHATVTAADGTVLDDYATPYGALYRAWSLNIRIEGEGVDGIVQAGQTDRIIVAVVQGDGQPVSPPAEVRGLDDGEGKKFLEVPVGGDQGGALDLVAGPVALGHALYNALDGPLAGRDDAGDGALDALLDGAVLGGEER